MTQIETFAGTRDPDIRETAFLFELIGITKRAHMREDSVFQTNEKHAREFESLG